MVSILWKPTGLLFLLRPVVWILTIGTGKKRIGPWVEEAWALIGVLRELTDVGLANEPRGWYTDRPEQNRLVLKR